MKNEKMIEQEALKKEVEDRFEGKCRKKAGIVGLIILVILLALELLFENFSIKMEEIIPACIGSIWVALCTSALYLLFSVNNGEKEKGKILLSLSEEEKEKIIIVYKDKKNHGTKK